MGRLADPLTDPLPGPAQVPRPPFRDEAAAAGPPSHVGPETGAERPAGDGSPWFRDRAAQPAPRTPPASPATPPPDASAPLAAPGGTPPPRVTPQGPGATPRGASHRGATPGRAAALPPRTAHGPYGPAGGYPAGVGPATAAPTSPAHPVDEISAPYVVDEAPGDSVGLDNTTMALRQARLPGGQDGSGAEADESAVSRETVPGGRAARRKAAQQAARKRGRPRSGAMTESAADASTPKAPLSRVEARRLEREQKEGVGVIASRAIGETFITLGVLMLLFVVYQLWWTNVRADQEAGGTANSLQKEWTSKNDASGSAGVFSPGQGFAIMYIPKLDVKAPIAQGVSKTGVLDKGMVGHYDQGSLKTAMPWDKTGNFATAAHRNTHGEPFRYINRLVKGDKVVVETSSKYYTYEVTSMLPQTSSANTSVIEPVPPQSGFTKPGRYITLTTCTPEFTSTYRLIVWGKMVDERPRSKGAPPALAN